MHFLPIKKNNDLKIINNQTWELLILVRYVLYIFEEWLISFWLMVKGQDLHSSKLIPIRLISELLH